MLPINMQLPTYELTLPSNGKKISYRPFVEYERKLLLMAVETKEKKEYLIAIKKIIESCCENVNPENLAIFDLEYIFIHLRAKSIGEIVKLNFRCDNVVEGKSCGKIMNPEVDLTKVEVEGVRKDLKIKLTPTFGVKMKYPSIEAINISYDITSRNYLYEIILNSIDFIWENENIYYTKDYDKSDILDFIMKLTHDQFTKLEEFIGEMPILRKVLIHKCPKCSFEHTITLEGYQSFFI